MFYAFAIFGVAWTLGLRAGIGFAFACVTVSWAANFSTYPFAELSGYMWSAANRTVGFLFVAVCGNALRSYRDEALARVAAMEHARRLEQEIVRGAESEQRTIGQDLHDGACQSLAAIDCATELLKRALQEDGGAHVASAEAIQQMLRTTNAEIRNLARAMAPVNLTSDGLPDAIETLVGTTNLLRGTAVSFRVDGEIRLFDPDVAIHLYRIAQEALSNAMKHARAAHVAVTLEREEGALVLTVADDGRGLPDKGGPSSGMGLHTMEYRANLIGAGFSIENSAQGGVVVKCVLPDRSAPVGAPRKDASIPVLDTLSKAVL